MTTSIAVAVFLSIAFVGSGIGVGVYDFYNYEEVSMLNYHNLITHHPMISLLIQAKMIMIVTLLIL